MFGAVSSFTEEKKSVKRVLIPQRNGTKSPCSYCRTLVTLKWLDGFFNNVKELLINSIVLGFNI